MAFWNFNWVRGWLGLNPSLPFYWEVMQPKHGDKAKNKLGQKVIFDEKQDNRWVMAGNFSDKKPVTIK